MWLVTAKRTHYLSTVLMQLHCCLAHEYELMPAKENHCWSKKTRFLDLLARCLGRWPQKMQDAVSGTDLHPSAKFQSNQFSSFGWERCVSETDTQIGTHTNSKLSTPITPGETTTMAVTGAMHNVRRMFIALPSWQSFTWFIRWLRNGTKWLPTIRPSQLTWPVCLPLGCYFLHSPSPFIIILHEADSQITNPRRAEGWANLWTANAKGCILQSLSH